MLKFVFLLTIWNANTPAMQVNVADYALSGSDCIAAMESYSATDPAYSKGIPSCEIDAGNWIEESDAGDSGPFEFYAVEHKGEYIVLPACDAEDSVNCVWDAKARGNGNGDSFYDLNGDAYPLGL